MSELKVLYRGEESAVVESGSQGEAEMKAIGFVDEEPEAEESDEQPIKRGPGRPRKK